MTSAETVIAAAFISSLPGWAAVYVTVANRLALKKQTAVLRQDTVAQTAQLQAHIDTSAATVPAEGRNTEDA